MVTFKRKFKKIWKFSFPYLNSTHKTISIPSGSKLIHIEASQVDTHRVINMWFEVLATEPLEERHFKVFPTGEDIPFEFEYVATVMAKPLVLHLYETPNENVANMKPLFEIDDERTWAVNH